MTDINQIVQLYFEADRSPVKLRYDEIYDLIEQDEPAGVPAVDKATEATDTEESSSDPFDTKKVKHQNQELSEKALDDEFHEVLDFSEIRNELTGKLVQRWQDFDTRNKVVALHYLVELCQDDFTLEHAWEGIERLFTTWEASGFLHAVFPDEIFPVDTRSGSTVLSYQELRKILDLLGIHFDDSKEGSGFEVWRNLSAAVNAYRVKHKFEPWQMWALVFDLGPRLLPSPPPYLSVPPPKVWFVATNDHFGEFKEIDNHGPENVGNWAINKRAKRGDIAIMYCVSPRSAITSVYRILEDAHYDPFGGWTDYRAKLAEKIPVPWIKFTEIKADSILREWNLVKRSFQGLLKIEVPENCWLRLLEIITERDPAAGERLNQFRNAAKGTREIKVADETWSEKEVEDQFAIPVLERIGWKIGTTMVQQVSMRIKVGSGKPKEVLADFVGYDGALTSQVLLVVEAKRQIGSTRELEQAVEQAESYAGKLRCTRFAIVSPEGFWVYELCFPGQSQQLASIEIASVDVDTAASQVAVHIGYEQLRSNGRRHER